MAKSTTTVEETGEGTRPRATPVFVQTTIDQVFGSLRHSGPALSVEDMDEAVAKEAKSRALFG